MFLNKKVVFRDAKLPFRRRVYYALQVTHIACHSYQLSNQRRVAGKTSRPGGAAESEQLLPACIALTFYSAWAIFAVLVNEMLLKVLISLSFTYLNTDVQKHDDLPYF
jgi:hypothetical protein